MLLGVHTINIVHKYLLRVLCIDTKLSLLLTVVYYHRFCHVCVCVFVCVRVCVAKNSNQVLKSAILPPHLIGCASLDKSRMIIIIP